MRAHRHARTLPNPEALGPDIEEGAVNRHPLQVLFLLLEVATGPLRPRRHLATDYLLR